MNDPDPAAEATDDTGFEESPSTNPGVDPMHNLALELLKQNRVGHANMVAAIGQTSEFSVNAINDLRQSTAEEASKDRGQSSKDMRYMMILIMGFGALIAALSGLNIMFDGSSVGAPSVTIEGTPVAPAAAPAAPKE